MTRLNEQRGHLDRSKNFFARWWRRVRCWLGKHEPQTRLKLYVLRNPMPGGRRRRVLVRMDCCVHCDYVITMKPLGHIRPQKRD